VQVQGYIYFGSTMQMKRYQYAGASTRLLLLCALFLGCSFDESFGLEFNNRNRPDLLILRVGEEVKKEKLALQEGSSYEYEVRGLQLSKWYEIKISYPASVCFSSPPPPPISQTTLGLQGATVSTSSVIVEHIEFCIVYPCFYKVIFVVLSFSSFSNNFRLHTVGCRSRDSKMTYHCKKPNHHSNNWNARTIV
jgi:hypothetical protein